MPSATTSVCARFTLTWTDVLRRLLGPGPGAASTSAAGPVCISARLLGLGWTATGVDLSADQLRLARTRHPEVELVQGDASSLPFADASFDAVASVFTHTDMDDYAGTVGEGARVLVPGGRFVHVGLHPCFVGPFARYIGEDQAPELFPGYREIRLGDRGPGTRRGPRGGWSARATSRLPSSSRRSSTAGLVLDRFEEPRRRRVSRTSSRVAGYRR